MTRGTRHRLEGWLAAGVGALVGVLPRAVMLGVGRTLGRLWGALDQRHLAIAKDGLRLYTRSSDVAWSDTAWADTMQLTNPLETLTDALTPRISLKAFDGASGTDFTQLFAFTFTGYGYRLYAATDGGSPNLTLMLTINARWDGSNWVKDTGSQASSRIVLYVVPAAGVGNQGIWFQDCKTTDTFPESDWTALPTSTALKNSGGTLYTGRVSAGSISDSPNPQGRFSAFPDGFGDGATASTFFVDSIKSFDSPNWFIDQFGLIDSHGGMLYEEFANNAAPSGWSAATSGAGAVEYNYNGVSRIRLNPGASDSAGIRSNAQLVTGAYGSFNVELLWENVLGKVQIGLCDTAANLDMGFVQDSATYGDEKLRVVLRTGAGLQVADTGVSISSLTNSWIKLLAYARGGSGLLTTTSVFWRLASKKSNASGVFTPGGAIVNPTTGRVWRADAQTGQLVVIERLCVGGHSNFGI